MKGYLVIAAALVIALTGCPEGTRTGNAIAIPGVPSQLAFGAPPQSLEVAGTIWTTDGVNPITVRVEDAFGDLVTTDNMTQVTVSLTNGSGILSGTLTQTAVGGIATFADLSYTVAEPITLTFTSVPPVGSIENTVSTIVPAPPNVLVFGTAPDTVQTAGTVWSAFTVEIQDVFGNVVISDNSTQITLTETGSGAFTGTATVAVINGVATFSDVTYIIAETMDVSAGSVPGYMAPAPVAVTVDPGPPDHLVFGSAPQASEEAGDLWTTDGTNPITVEVQDAYGNLLTAVNDQITISLTSGSGVLNGTLTLNTVGGVATFSDISYNVAESIAFDIVSDVLGISGIIETPITINPGFGDHLAFGTLPATPQTAGATWASFIVRVEDAYNNLVTTDNGTIVTITEDGTGAFSGTVARMAVAGIATFNDISYTVAELINVEAVSAPSYTSPPTVPVTVNPGVPDHLSFEVSPPAGAAPGATWDAFSVRVEDSVGNLVPGASGTVSVALTGTPAGALNGTLTRPLTGGIATFDDLSYGLPENLTYAIDTTVMGVIGLPSNMIGIFGAADHLAFGISPQSPQTAGAVWSGFTVRVEDAAGILVADDNTTVITINENGSGSFWGTVTRTVVNGIATFDDITYTVAEPIQVGATSVPSYTSPATVPVTINPAAASKLLYGTAPVATQIANVAWAVFTVRVADTFGNLIITDNTTAITLSLAAGTGVLGGTLTRTVTGGVASFNDITHDTAEAIWFDVTANPVLTPILGTSVTVSQGPPDHLAFGTTPNTTETAGYGWGAFTVRVEDAYNNLVTTDNTTMVTLIENGAGMFTGTNPRMVVAGIATFNDINYTMAETLSVSAVSVPLLTQAATVPVTVLPAPADHLSFGTLPSTPVTESATWPAFTVEVRDVFENVISTDVYTQVTITLGAGGGVLTGTLTRVMVNGVATYDDLVYDKVDMIDLQVSSTPALPVVVSNVIDVQTAGGVSGYGPRMNPSLSEDGALVVFDSTDETLAMGDTNGYRDVFVQNVAGGTISLVSVGAADGASLAPVLSSNGQFVAFESDATDLVAGDTNKRRDIFVRDLMSGTTERISLASTGAEANGPCSHAAISSDGRFVAFHSNATNLIPGDANARSDVFVRDRMLSTITRVSISSAGGEGNGDSLNPSSSADGRFVAFESDSFNLAGGDANGVRDIFIHDRDTDADGIYDEPGFISTTRVSVDLGDLDSDGGSQNASISADGNYVAFASWATDLVVGDTSAVTDIFVRDIAGAVTVRASVSTMGGEANGSSRRPSISGDGHFVLFQSDATNLVTGDGGALADIFVRDLTMGTTARVSVDTMGGDPDGPSFRPAISADGTTAAFETNATDILSGDMNDVADVVVVPNPLAP